MTIVFPNRVGSNVEGFGFLLELSNSLQNIFFEDVTLDFSKLEWLDANLCAVLGAIISAAEERLNSVELIHLHAKTRGILERNNFLSYYSNQGRMDRKSTVIAYRKFKVSDEGAFRDYVDGELLSMPDLPIMTPLARKKILESIFEIFNNAVIHSGCTHIFTCGQYYPTRKDLEFTMVDLGKTIQSNVSNYLRQELSGSESIGWAVEEGRTTKIGNIPGGLGLSIIRSFLRLNGGEIQIVSSNGYWEERGSERVINNLKHAFPGTIVNLEFNMGDLNSYRLKSESTNDPIF